MKDCDEWKLPDAAVENSEESSILEIKKFHAPFSVLGKFLECLRFEN
jgi:hypothetical protein